MKRLIGKVRKRLNTSGESVIEALAAVVVCSLALLMLYTALASAGRMNAMADERASQYWSEVSVVESQVAAGASEYGEVRVSGFDETYDVEIFGSESGVFSSYRLL